MLSTRNIKLHVRTTTGDDLHSQTLIVVPCATLRSRAKCSWRTPSIYRTCLLRAVLIFAFHLLNLDTLDFLILEAQLILEVPMNTLHLQILLHMFEVTHIASALATWTHKNCAEPDRPRGFHALAIRKRPVPARTFPAVFEVQHLSPEAPQKPRRKVAYWWADQMSRHGLGHCKWHSKSHHISSTFWTDNRCSKRSAS